MSFSWPCWKCGHFSVNYSNCEKCGDWARVECPTCGAKPDHRCRALTSGRSTDAHSRRREMGNLDRYQRSQASRPGGDAA